MTSSALQSLSEVFNNKFFRIPDYQRGYAWGKQQLEDFWDDLMNLKNGKYHYTGLLTVENIEKSEAIQLKLWEDDEWLYEKGFKSYYVIDGQQRLLTIMILLKVILDKFSDEEEINYTVKKGWAEKYFYQKSAKYEAFIFGYEKDNPSDEYYRTKILEKKSLNNNNQSEETLYTANLKEAKDFFITKTRGLDKEALQIIAKKLTNGLRFNFYEIDDELDVFVTFETMNNRGKQLSKLELLKNRLIYLSTLLTECEDDDKRQLRRDINETWKTIYHYLGKNKEKLLDDDDFLENHWSMYFTYTRQEAKAFSKFLLNNYFTANNVLDKDPKNKVGFDEIKEYIGSISECVKQWFFIFNPSYSQYNSEIKMWLEKLNMLRIGSFAPLIMAVLVKDVKDSKIVELLKEVERFIFLVFRVTNRKGNTGNSFFYKVAHDFYYGEMTINKVVKEINDFIQCRSNNYGFDIEEFTNFIDNRFKKQEEGYYNWNGIKYLLYEYELYLKVNARGNLKVSWDDIKTDSIEHIYPQNPSKNSDWGKIFGRHKFNNKEKYRLLHSLGNLLLLSSPKNAELQGYSFQYKKKHQDKHGNYTGYFNGSYSEIEVAQYDKWTPEEIFERGLNILEFMEVRWRIEIYNMPRVLGLEFMT